MESWLDSTLFYRNHRQTSPTETVLSVLGQISTPQTANEEEEEEEEEASFTEKEITEGQPRTSPENETGQQRQNV